MEIDGSASENYSKKRLKKVKSLSQTSNTFRSTNLQRTETVKEYRRLKDSKTEDYEILSLKFFYEEFYPAEFDVHTKFNNWSTAKINKYHIRSWVQSVERQENIEIEKKELEKMKSKQQIRKEKAHEKQLKAFMNKPRVTIEISPEEQEQIVTRLGEKMFDFNPENKKLVAGSNEKPHLYHISSGQRKNALIFHVKIGIYCYELYLSNVLKNSCLFSCRDKYCNAKAKFELKSEFIMREVIPRANGALPRINFTVDRQDPKLRELEKLDLVANL
jgi:hypothetical protein